MALVVKDPVAVLDLQLPSARLLVPEGRDNSMVKLDVGIDVVLGRDRLEVLLKLGSRCIAVARGSRGSAASRARYGFLDAQSRPIRVGLEAEHDKSET